MYFLLRASTVAWSHNHYAATLHSLEFFCHSRISKRNKHLFAQNLIIEPLTNKVMAKNLLLRDCVNKGDRKDIGLRFGIFTTKQLHGLYLSDLNCLIILQLWITVDYLEKTEKKKCLLKFSNYCRFMKKLCVFPETLMSGKLILK